MKKVTYQVSRVVSGCFFPAVDAINVIVRVFEPGGVAEIKLNKCTLPEAMRVAENHLRAHSECIEVIISKGKQTLMVVPQTMKRYQVGMMLTAVEAAKWIGTASGGWFKDNTGQEVYICDGSHKDGSRGFKVLQVGGLR